MTAKRINITLDEEVLSKLDAIAESANNTRSGMISDFVKGDKSIDTRFAQVKEYAASLQSEIDATKSYEERQSAKSDAFYQLLGFINALDV